MFNGLCQVMKQGGVSRGWWGLELGTGGVGETSSVPPYFYRLVNPRPKKRSSRTVVVIRLEYQSYAPTLKILEIKISK